MQITEAEEAISRFIGMFGMLEVDPRFRADVHELEAFTGKVALFSGQALAYGGFSSFDPRAQSPQLRFGNDRFEVENAPFGMPSPNVPRGIPPLGEPSTGSSSLPDPVSLAPSDANGGGVVFPDPTFAYRDAAGDSLVAEYRQINLLDDRDTLVFGEDSEVLDVPEAVARNFARMIDLAGSTGSTPIPPADAAEMGRVLAIAPGPDADAVAGGSSRQGFAASSDEGADWTLAIHAHRAEVAPGAWTGAPSELQGIFVDGVQASAAPDFAALFASLRAADAAPAGSTLHTGGNILSSQAAITNVGDLASVSVVMGDWHETNAIRQFNIYADGDSIEGFGPGGIVDRGTEALNFAEFRRIDATPQDPAALQNPGFFPSRYQVDVLEGDLRISNFLSQLNFLADGDRVSLTAMQATVTATLGANESASGASLLKTLGAYDLVIIGGSVFEGNFIQQFNIMSDNDRLVSEMTGENAAGLSGTVGGNLVLNTATIVNYGGVGDLIPLNPAMSKLVGAIGANAASGDLDSGTELGFLLSSNIRVLYLTGDVYEMNVVSQMNVLDDSDTVLASDGPVGAFVAAAGSDASWTITSGGNGLVNAASITDVDDVAFKRFAQGQYYSESMLIQAEIVSRGHDFATYDVSRLAPEIVAFLDDDAADDALSGAMRGFDHDASADGLAGMLS